MRDAESDLKSKQLEEELERQMAEENAIIKLLVLGTGESGKSTVFKQMKILYSVPDPPAKFIMICRANLFSNSRSKPLEQRVSMLLDRAPKQLEHARQAQLSAILNQPARNARRISRGIDELLLRLDEQLW